MSDFNFDEILDQHDKMDSEDPSANTATATAAPEEEEEQEADAAALEDQGQLDDDESTATAEAADLDLNEASSDGNAPAEEAASKEPQEAQSDEQSSQAEQGRQAESAAAQTAGSPDAAERQEATSSGDEEMEDYGTVELTVEGQVLATALKEATGAFKENADLTYIAAVKTGDLFASNAIAGQAGEGRLIVGSMGEGRDHYFVDVPLKGIEEEGRFLINEPDRLQNFAKKVGSGTFSLRHYRDGLQRFLDLSEPDRSAYQMEVRLSYNDEEIKELFPAYLDRFGQPSDAFQSEELAEMLSRADSVRTSASSDSRAGDLIWTENQVEFASQVGHGEHTLAASLKADFESDYEFEWAVRADVLEALSSALSTGSAVYNVDESALDENEEPLPPVMQIATTEPLDDTDVMHTHRQLQIQSDSGSVKSWLDASETDKDDLFGSKFCKLWATMQTEQLFQTVGKAWSLFPSAVVSMQRQVNDNTPQVLLLSGNHEDPNRERIGATQGDSSIDELYVHPDVAGAMESVTQGHDFFQVLSYPDSSEEIENAMIVVPLKEGEDPSVKQTDPSSYLIVVWQP